ncbi:MAG: winged helix-turn-helix transcriptional regulator [Geminicoccaceae bacterium]|nr:winged helix-turn-helix transcriptional regulator [Geminicoccaceae bacterium]
MNETDAVRALAALGQPTRLSALRLLAQTGGGGMAAGEIAAALGVPASTLSHHLGLLEGAGLVESLRDQRHIFYRVAASGTRGLLAFLINDLLHGQSELAGAEVRRSASARWDRPRQRPRGTRTR